MRIDYTRTGLCLNGRFVLVADRTGREWTDWSFVMARDSLRSHYVFRS